MKSMDNGNAVGLKRASKWAVFFYGFGDIASQFIWTFVGGYLSFYYTDILGIAPAIVSVLLLIARVWDAVDDPIQGAIVDRYKTRWGRYRPWIIVGGPLLAISGVLVFANPFTGASRAGVIWAAITYLVCGIAYSMINIPYGALANVMSEDPDQRVQIQSSRGVGSNIGKICVNALASLLILAFSVNHAKADARGYIGTIVVFALVSIPLFWSVAFSAKEYIHPPSQGGKIRVGDMYKNAITNKYLLIVCVTTFFWLFAAIGRASVMIYYCTYYVGNFAMMSIITTLPYIFSMISNLFIPALLKKFGSKKRLLIASLICQGLSVLVVFMAPKSNLVVVFVGQALLGLSNIAYPLTLAMIGDAMDFQEYKTGKRTDGTAFALQGLTSKFAPAVASSVLMALLGMSGYVANAEQTAEALVGINLLTNGFPVLLYFAAAVAVFFWDLKESKVADMRKEIEVRNNKE